MLFSSVTFLYWFIPIAFAGYFILPKSRNGKIPYLRNSWLLICSFVFYAWGEPKYSVLVVIQIISGWGFALLMDKAKTVSMRRVWLIASLVIGFGALGYFKYADFFIDNANRFGAEIPFLRLALPIGISFYTFQILSYDIDLYRKETSVQKNPFTFATYVTLFPQLIAGPIVRYVDVERELMQRHVTAEEFGAGVRRLTAGLAKKVLIANVMAEYAGIAAHHNTVLGSWGYVIAYSLQIYFDFSGYSDMAIGMGWMLGFKFLENFNYPYISKSVTDFWRRWHMSLSTWFRDYVYIPLGGNRCGKLRQVFNIAVVWLLTGFWHGAGWNFILWGAYFGALLLLEKFVLSKFLAKLPGALQHVYLIALVLIGWVCFNASDDPSGLGISGRLLSLIGIGTDSLSSPETFYYVKSFALTIILGIIGATPLPKLLLKKAEDHRVFSKILTVAEPVIVAVLLLMVSAYLADGSFNPFIYFRF